VANSAIAIAIGRWLAGAFGLGALACGHAGGDVPPRAARAEVALCSGFEVDVKADPAAASDTAGEGAQTRLKVDVTQGERAGTRLQPPRVVWTADVSVRKVGDRYRPLAALGMRWTDPDDAGTRGHRCAEELEIRMSDVSRPGAAGGAPLLVLTLREDQAGLRVLAQHGAGWSAGVSGRTLTITGLGPALTYRSLIAADPP
jgi:hypothetical protein